MMAPAQIAQMVFPRIAFKVLLMCGLFVASAAQGASYSGLNHISIRLGEAEFKRVIVGRGVKVDAKAEIAVNGGAFIKGEIESRGQSCLIAAKRPCLNIKFENRQKFLGPSGLEGKTLSLVSMWQDRGYFSSKLGFEIFRELGIFDIRSEYTLLTINDRPYGLYLITDKPKKVIERMTDKAWIARRGYRTRIEVVEDSKAVPKAEGVKRFQDLYKVVASQSGQRLYEELQTRMNLERYMHWLLINSVLMNGDFADEVFFYIDGADPSRRFDIMPWDFDDLFKPPHSSAENTAHKSQIENGLLYGFENPLDQKIHSDPVLNAALYLEAKKLLAKLTPELVGRVVDRIRLDLERYGAEQAVLEGGALDSYRKPYTLDFLKKNADGRKVEILKRLAILKARLH